MSTLNVGLIGAGRVAQAHLKACAALGDRVKVLAVCDADGEKARATAEKAGAQIAETDYRRLLSEDSVDAVIISLPHEFHPEAVIEAARAGKQILVEKPMALHLAEAEEMVQAAETATRSAATGEVVRL